MGRKQRSGLYLRGGIWHIDKIVRGLRICESTGTSNVREAEEILARRVDEARSASIFGIRPERTFRKAATKFLLENQHLASIDSYALHLKQLDPYIGDLPIAKIHTGTLAPFVKARKKAGRKTKTINLALAAVRHILNLAADEWIDEHGLTWLERAPKIKLMPVKDERKAHPLTYEEQGHLLRELPDYLANMALFNVNTGTREQEVCHLRWDWEIPVPELNTSVFLIPKDFVKNGEERLVVLNRIATQVIEAQRGKHADYVFPYKDQMVSAGMNNTKWQRARVYAAINMAVATGRFERIDVVPQGSKRDFAWKIVGKRPGEAAEDVITYTLAQYDAARIKRGLEPLRTIAWVYSEKQLMRNKAILLFIEAYCPELLAFARVRVHDLKHTFGRRLRAAGVSFEDRQDLLGHKSGRITTHYSAAELENLIHAANNVCGDKSRKSPALVVLERKTG